MNARHAIVFVLLGSASGAATSAQNPSAPSELVREVAGDRPTVEQTLERGRNYTEQFLGGQLETLLPQLSPQLKRSLGKASGLDALRLRIRAQAGDETQVVDERVIPWLGARIYSRTSQFSIASKPVWMRWTLNKDGVATGFVVTPQAEPARSTHLKYEDRTRLQLPFTGTWFVFWGGRTLLENYHAANAQQRFAYDLLIAHNGQTHRGLGRKNTDYFCFNQPILAPAAATVVSAVDGIDENRPGLMNEQQPFGNHVILEHGSGEFSVLAHLRKGSVAVKPGERVETGHLLGRCGNSGRSSEPHLHFHLQNDPDLGEGAGLPAQFHDYLADGVAVTGGEPRRGMVLTATAAPAMTRAEISAPQAERHSLADRKNGPPEGSARAQ